MLCYIKDAHFNNMSLQFFQLQKYELNEGPQNYFYQSTKRIRLYGKVNSFMVDLGE